MTNYFIGYSFWGFLLFFILIISRLRGLGPAFEKVYVLFVLGAVDSNSHIETLTELMDIIDDEDKIEALIKAENINEMLEII